MDGTSLRLQRAVETRLDTVARHLQRRWEAWFESLPPAELPGEIGLFDRLEDPDLSRRYVYCLGQRETPIPAAARGAVVEILEKNLLTDTMLDRHLDALARDEPGALATLQGIAGQCDLSETHPVLRACLRALPPERWPPGPYHRGEFRPDIGALGYVALARTLETAVATPAFKARFAGAAQKESQTRPDMAGGSLRPHAAAVTKGLITSGHPDDPTAEAFVTLVDQQLRRFDVIHALRKRKKEPTSPVRSCVWRSDNGKRVILHIAQLDDVRFGMLFKPKSRYVWLEGGEDEVLASVPDALFPGAMAAMFQR